MANNTTHPNILKYYLAHIFQGVSLIAPIIILYYASFGLSFFDIASLQAIFLITTIVLEIPTGAMADIVGRKFSAGLGILLIAIGTIIVGAGSSFVQFALAEIIFGIGAAMRSGADTSLIYDSLQETSSIDKYTKTEGISYSLFCTIGALTAPLGAYLFRSNHRAPFLIEAFILLLAALSFIFMIEPKIIKPTGAKNDYWSTLISGIKQPLRNPLVRWYFIFTIFIAVIISFFGGVLIQPLIVARGINIIYVGYIYSALLLIQAVSAIYADDIASRLKERLSLAAIIIIPSISLIMMGLKNAGVFLVFLLIYSSVKGFEYPVLKNYVQQRLLPAARATALSTQNFFDSLAGAIFLPVLGLIADNISLSYSAPLLGIIMLGGGVLLLILKPKNE